MECMINQAAFEALPADLQSIVMSACKAVNADMLAEFTARNNRRCRHWCMNTTCDVREFPKPVLDKLRAISMRWLRSLPGRMNRLHWCTSPIVSFSSKCWRGTIFRSVPILMFAVASSLAGVNG